MFKISNSLSLKNSSFVYKELDFTKLEFCLQVKNSILQNLSSTWRFLIKKIHLNECRRDYFYRTRILETRVTRETQFSQTKVLKRWYIAKYFQISGSLQKISANSSIWPSRFTKRFNIWDKNVFFHKKECIF